MGMGGPPPPPPPPPIMKPPPLVTERKKMPQVRTLTSPNSENDNIAASDSRLPQQETPKPKAKMKTLNWNKIPSNKVKNSGSKTFKCQRRTQIKRQDKVFICAGTV